MNSIDFHTKRTVKVISLDSQDDINELLENNIETIPQVVLSFKKNNRIKHMDIGSWSYSITKTRMLNKSHDNIGSLVDTKSLKKDRLLGIKFLLEDLLNTKKSNNTILYFYKETNPIFNYLNKNFDNYDCSNIKDAEKIYIEYSKYLVNNIAIRSGNSECVSSEHHRYKQEILANFLSACTQTNINRFYLIFKRIQSVRVIKPVNKNEISQSTNDKVKVLLHVFNTLSDYIINDEPLPYIVDLKYFNLKKIHIDQNLINKSQESFINLFYENNKIVSIDKFNINIDEYFKDCEHHEKGLKKRIYRKKYHAKLKAIKVLNTLDFKKCGPKIMIANFCMITFAKLLISTSGANESVIYDLKIDGFKTISNEKGKRSFVIKNRARGKVIALEFGLKFQKLFDKYQLFRKKINSLYDNIPDDFEKLLFIRLPLLNNARSYNSVTKVDSYSFDQYNKVFKILFGESPAQNKELRLNVANSYFNSTNSSLFTSIKLGNTPKVASESYADTSLSEISEQFSNYFKNFDNKIIFKGRNNTNLIPVKIESNNEISTFIGNCSKDAPKLIEDFNDETPVPTYGKPNSCLYCNSYIIHLNKIDIKKLLSFKFILEYNTQIREEQQRIIYRIEEIIRYIKIKDPSIENLINEINSEVNEGYLDEYWENHLNMLVDMTDFT